MPAAGPRPIGRPTEGEAGTFRYLTFTHRIVLGSGGAISSQDPAKDTKVVAVKTAAKVGRYTLTLSNGRRFRQFRGGTVDIVGLTDAIYGANTTGYKHHWRNDLLSTVGTVELQFTQNGTNADAEVPDNFVLVISVKVRV